MSLFRKLFGAKSSAASTETPEQAVQRVLRSLPKCTSKILVAGPTYGDDEYMGDVLVEAAGLRLWAVRQSEGSYHSDPEIQAASEVLPIWLRAADSADERPTPVPRSMIALMHAYVPDFFSMGIATIWCPNCEKRYSDMVQERKREDRDGTNFDATHEWYCLKGHLLYRRRSRTHIVRSRN